MADNSQSFHLVSLFQLAELIESNGQDFLRLCNDTAVFSKYFPIASNSSVDGARLQASVCGTSQVNVEKLWTELQSNMAGLAEYVDIVSISVQCCKHGTDFFCLFFKLVK